jgi:hypothetical protein
MLYHPDLNDAIDEGDKAPATTEIRTFPNAPLPTQRRRTKWNRLTSPSKSTGCIDTNELFIGRQLAQTCSYLWTTAHSTHGRI